MSVFGFQNKPKDLEFPDCLDPDRRLESTKTSGCQFLIISLKLFDEFPKINSGIQVLPGFTGHESKIVNRIRVLQNPWSPILDFLKETFSIVFQKNLKRFRKEPLLGFSKTASHS